MRKKNYEEAFKAYTKAININPNFAPAYISRSYLHIQNAKEQRRMRMIMRLLRKASKSNSRFKKAKTIDPKNPTIYNYFGFVYYLKEDFQKAISYNKQSN